MGKIHEALKRVQRRTTTAAGSAADDSAWPVSDNDDWDSPEWSFCGRQITIDSDALVAAELLEPAHSHPAVMAEYEPIKVSVLKAADTDGRSAQTAGNLLAVSSALPGEGKTFISLNLAMNLAKDAAWSVVLIDSALEHPHLSRVFGTASDPGFTDWLAEPAMEILDIVMPTDVPGLAFLPVGQQRAAAQDNLMLRSLPERLALVAAQNTHTVFLIDAPAVAQSDATITLAKLVGQMLFVVRAGATEKSQVSRALQRLDRSRHVNLVLNQLPTKRELSRS